MELSPCPRQRLPIDRRTRAFGAGGRLCAAGLVVALGWLSASVAHAYAEPDDAAIGRAVEARLRQSGAVLVRGMDAVSTGGIVTLWGAVDSLWDRRYALELAKTVRGVRAVIDALWLEPRKIGNGTLRAEVLRALKADPAIEVDDLHVVIAGHQVAVAGTVGSLQERRRAVTTVEKVSGVEAVDELIRIRRRFPRADREILEDVYSRLRADPYVDDHGLSVKVSGRRVEISGVVPTTPARDRVIAAAGGLGVRAVDASRLVVDAKRADPRFRDRAPVVAAPALRAAVLDAVRSDRRIGLEAKRIAARIEGSAVVLSGSGLTLRCKRAAEQDARHVVGVTAVRSRLVARSLSPRSDARIVARVRRTFAADPLLTRYRLRVDVLEGRVRLGGSVASLFGRQLATALVGRIDGVRRIDNRIDVAIKPATGAQWRFVSGVYERLYREPGVDLRRIGVAVRGRHVALSGMVDDVLARYSAERAARLAGAARVENALRVRRWLEVEAAG